MTKQNKRPPPSKKKQKNKMQLIFCQMLIPRIG